MLSSAAAPADKTALAFRASLVATDVTFGLGTLGGFAGGVGVIGGAQALTSSLAGQTSGYAVVLMLSIVFLWLKPDGLFARR